MCVYVDIYQIVAAQRRVRHGQLVNAHSILSRSLWRYITTVVQVSFVACAQPLDLEAQCFALLLAAFALVCVCECVCVCV